MEWTCVNENGEEDIITTSKDRITLRDNELTRSLFIDNSVYPEKSIPLNESILLYDDGPIPTDRESKFWGLFGDHTGKSFMKNVTEQNVFNKLLRHYNSNGEKDWEIGIGLGGQLYSWRLFSFYDKTKKEREIIPPQCDPWTDEVWQATTFSRDVDQLWKAIKTYDSKETNLHRTVGSPFVQTGGCDHGWDAKAPTRQAVFYSPPVVDYYNSKTKTYTIVNLGTTSGLPSCFYHKILFYNKYRYLGKGVLEITNVVYNFDNKYHYPFGGAPWGAIRTSEFPHLFTSDDTKHGNPQFVNVYYGHEGSAIDSNKTGGYIGAASSRNDLNCRAFVFAFGNHYPYQKIQNGDKRPALTTFGYVGNYKTHEMGKRDMTVMATSVRGMQGPGDNYWIRYYLILNTMKSAVDLAKHYQRKADYGVLNLKESTSTLHPLYKKVLENGDIILTREKSSKKENGDGVDDTPVFRVYNEPIKKSMPLFVISEMQDQEEQQQQQEEEDDMQQQQKQQQEPKKEKKKEKTILKSIVTTDPYELSYKEEWTNPVPDGKEHHDDLNNVKKCSMYQSQNGKLLKWDLLGFVIPIHKKQAGSRRKGYVDISTIIPPSSSSGTKGMLALKSSNEDFTYHDMKVIKKEQSGKYLKVKVIVHVKYNGSGSDDDDDDDGNDNAAVAIATPRLYLTDIKSSVPTVTNKRVNGKNVLLERKQKYKQVEFFLTEEHFSLVDDFGYHIVEPGEFILKIGNNEHDIIISRKVNIEHKIVIRHDPRFKPKQQQQQQTTGTDRREEESQVGDETDLKCVVNDKEEGVKGGSSFDNDDFCIP